MKKSVYDYYIIKREHKALRSPLSPESVSEYTKGNLSPDERVCRRFEIICKNEQPKIHPDEKIVLVRTVCDVKDCFSEEEWREIKKDHYIHELGYVSNLSLDYERVLQTGLLSLKEKATEYQARVIDAIIGLCDRYKEEAAKMGRNDIVEVLTQVPRYKARNFYEALQFFRILHYSLWLEGDYHNTVGRFDMYMYPYLEADMKKGLYTEETALELLEDFFISFNKDSDIYPGVQQGDNGQSMVLGGADLDGNYHFNTLSKLCLIASRNLKLIDPKINLRVCKNTPAEIYELATELTKVGLGFPQYNNDDVVIPGLIKMGYAPEDAIEYTVAACWEFIIPKVGNDIANIGALNFPQVVNTALRSENFSCFDDLMTCVKEGITAECDKITSSINNVWFAPSPFLDLLRSGRKYNNFGIHGCGISCAADSLAAVKKYVFDEKKFSLERIVKAIDDNFESDPELLHVLRHEAPKMGGDDSNVSTEISCIITEMFADALEGKKNCLGGIWRAGTGTAMFYLWHARNLGATADGRLAHEALGTNFSPTLTAKVNGPVSVIEAFSSQNFNRILNGGPLTLEFASSIFADDSSISKVAALIRYFISRGGHQLQLNAVNADMLKSAQKTPEEFRQLVVRIWGWSAYFIELDKEFQDHVISRQEYTV